MGSWNIHDINPETNAIILEIYNSKRLLNEEPFFIINYPWLKKTVLFTASWSKKTVDFPNHESFLYS
jgi:hypothetical protein